MEVADTRRMLYYMDSLFYNYMRSARAGMLEQEFSHQKTTYMKEIVPYECTQSFKNLVRVMTGFSESDCSQTLYPLKIISGYEFEQNPYLKNISLDEYHEDGVFLEKESFAAGELLTYDEPTFNNDMEQKMKYAVFDKDVSTYAIGSNDVLWMSIVPSEVNSMKFGIGNAHGRLLVLGGGLGYFPYMCALKDSVTSITIIESNPVIKKILEEQIIPQFPNNKTKVVEADAFEFLEAGISEKYDSVYADIWENNLAGIAPYRKLVKYEKNNPEIHFDYWLENGILNSVAGSVFSYFEAKIQHHSNPVIANENPDIFEYLENIHEKIERPSQLAYYLDSKFIKNMLLDIAG